MADGNHKRVRLEDIAKLAGVSKTVVSRVLLGTGGDRIWVSEKKAELIRKLGREMNYCANHMARQLRGMENKTIAVLIDFLGRDGEISYIYVKLLVTLEREAAKHDYRITFGRLSNDTELLDKYLSDFQSRGIDNILLYTDRYPETKILDSCLGRFKKVVLHSQVRPMAPPASPYILQDKASGINQAIMYLKDHGRTKIGLALHRYIYDQGIVTGSIGLLDPQRCNMCTDTGTSSPHILSRRKADEIVDELVLKNKADAVVCSNDFWALSIVNAAHRIGLKVPDDIAIIGYDNIEYLSEMEPALTTLDQQHDSVAITAINLFMGTNACTACGWDNLFEITPKLIVRDSAG
jgi:DNA-binding LacI/PurR family transcriptional regulator